MADNMMRIAGRGTDGTAKAISVDDSGKLKTLLAESVPKFDYASISTYVVVSVRGNTLYGREYSDGRKLHKSTDNGATWSAVIWTAPAIITIAHITTNGSLLVFLSNGTLYRSSDDGTFTSVLTGVASPLVGSGIDSNGNLVCFGEYVLNSGDPIRIYYSTDSGATWNIAINVKDTSGTPRHFHTCQYIGMLGLWIATTGDDTANWYKSLDGITWTLMFTTINQHFRTLGLIARKEKEIIWCSDGSSAYGGVFSTTLGGSYKTVDPTCFRRLITGTSSYGIAGSTEVIIYTTVATGVTNVKVASVYVSVDGGNTWQMDASFPIAAPGVGIGIIEILGPDYKGNYYLKFDDGVTTKTIKATYNIEKVKPVVREAAPYSAGVNKRILTRTLTVSNAPIGNTPFSYVPSPGYIETIVGFSFSVSAPSGATTGTHGIQLSVGGSGYVGRVFTTSAAYNKSLAFAPFGAVTDTTFTEGTADMFIRMMEHRRLNFINYDTLMPSFILYYQNNTDVARTTGVSVTMTVIQEAITPD